MMTPLTPQTQAQILMAKGNISNNYEGTKGWTQTYGGPELDLGSYVAQTMDGGYIITGYTASYGAGNTDVWLIKTDAAGQVIWNQTYGGPDHDGGFCVKQTTDGGYIITGLKGWSFGGTDNPDLWLIKTDIDGHVEWTQTYGGPEWDSGKCVEQTTEGGYIVIGVTGSSGDVETESNDASDQDVWLMKTDATGQVVWNQTYGGPDYDLGSWVEQIVDGGYIITGSTEFYEAGGEEVWLMKTDATGQVVWNQTYGGPESDRGWCVKQTADGGYIIVGMTESYGAGNFDVWLIKTDATGQAEWTQTYGGPEFDVGQSVGQTADSGYIIVGMTESYGAGNFDTWLIKTDATGQAEWTQTYGGSEWDGGSWVEQTADGGYIIVGGTVSYGTGGGDVWLVKTDKNGGIDSEFSWDMVFLALAVISITLAMGVVYAKRKR